MADQQWNRLFFDEWVKREGLDLIRGHATESLFTIELKPWARTGGNAVQIQLDGTGDINAAYVQELPPGKHTEPIRHLYDELVYVLSGRGSTTVWYEGTRKSTFEWQAGSLFAIPLNASYQHFNGSGTEPARYVAVTTAPIMLNLIRSEEFIFDNAATFPDRYDGSEDFFSAKHEMKEFTGWDIPTTIAFTNFVADINGLGWHKSLRGVNSRAQSFEVGNGVVGAHTSEYPGGTWTTLHRHGPGAHVLWLRGEGYTMIWADGAEDQKIKADWGPGVMLVPPSWWWHSHAITSPEPAQYIALKLGSKRYKLNRQSMGSMLSIRSGGNLMHFEDFPPEVMQELKDLFAAECAKHGTKVNMDPIYSRA